MVPHTVSQDRIVLLLRFGNPLYRNRLNGPEIVEFVKLRFRADVLGRNHVVVRRDAEAQPEGFGKAEDVLQSQVPRNGVMKMNGNTPCRIRRRLHVFRKVGIVRRRNRGNGTRNNRIPPEDQEGRYA